jgi:hypothetical protein
MYKEHNRSSVVNQSKRDYAPDIPRRRRSFEDLLAEGEIDDHQIQSRKERRMQKLSTSRSMKTTTEDGLGQSCHGSLSSNGNRRISPMSCSRHSKRKGRKSSHEGETKRSLSSRGTPTLPTIKEFCSDREGGSPDKTTASKLNLLTLAPRQSLQSYTKLFNALSLGSNDNQIDEDNAPVQNARFELEPSEKANVVMTPKLQSTIYAALSI